MHLKLKQLREIGDVEYIEAIRFPVRKGVRISILNPVFDHERQ